MVFADSLLIFTRGGERNVTNYRNILDKNLMVMDWTKNKHTLMWSPLADLRP